MRARLLVATFSISVLSAITPAAAQAALCENLRDALTRVRDVTGNTAEVRKYANALARQNMNIRKLRNDLQRYSCSSGSFTVFGGGNAHACQQLTASLDEMEENRRALTAQREALQGTVSSGTRERRRIMAALRDNGCDGTVQEASLVTPAPASETDSEFFTRIPSPGDSGQLRTMCVRTCDGSFFPISSNASTADFARDEAACNRMCPGTQTRLYYHSLTGAESADMVSATTGEPYRALPTAFAYRTRLPGEKPVCGCGAGSVAMPDSQDDEKDTAKADLRPTLASKAPKAADPAASAAAASVPERPYDPENNRVRVIGPQFMPGTSGALHPASPNG